MSQKEVLWDILNLLVIKPHHLREMAKKLETNPMAITRALNKLYQENIVDYETTGKNKIYTLRDNLVAKKKILALEQYKFEKLVKNYPKLVSIITHILDITKDENIILFGSYAKFQAKENSDIDIYVDTQSRDLRKRISNIHSKLSVKIGKFEKSTPLGKEIIKNHIILRGIESFYEEHKIFEEIAFRR